MLCSSSTVVFFFSQFDLKKKKKPVERFQPHKGNVLSVMDMPRLNQAEK